MLFLDNIMYMTAHKIYRSSVIIPNLVTFISLCEPDWIMVVLHGLPRAKAVSGDRVIETLTFNDLLIAELWFGTHTNEKCYHCPYIWNVPFLECNDSNGVWSPVSSFIWTFSKQFSASYKSNIYKLLSLKPEAIFTDILNQAGAFLQNINNWMAIAFRKKPEVV